jgi:hypothetical protein
MEPSAFLGLAMACAAAGAVSGCQAVLGLDDLRNRAAEAGGDDTAGGDSTAEAGLDATHGAPSADGPRAEDVAPGADAPSETSNDATSLREAAAEAASEGGGAGDGGGAEDARDADDAGDASADISPDCGKQPTLHMQPAGYVYCGLSADASTVTCSPGQECCLGGATGPVQYAPNDCRALGATCTNGGVPEAGSPGVPIECSQVLDCVASGKTNATACCLQGASNVTASGCFPQFTLGNAIVCEGTSGGAVTHCAAGETQVCSQQSDCPAGTTCTAGKWKIFQLGVCL